jgi:hypothetical protein
MVNQAAIVVVTSVPFGFGNLSNLEAALQALKQGTRTYVIDEIPVEVRDFTNGRATAMFAELRKKGAIFIKHPSELPTLVNATHKSIELCKLDQTEIPGHLKESVKVVHSKKQEAK